MFVCIIYGKTNFQQLIDEITFCLWTRNMHDGIKLNRKDYFYLQAFRAKCMPSPNKETQILVVRNLNSEF